MPDKQGQTGLESVENVFNSAAMDGYVITLPE
jgi:hypothetical protein